MMPRMSRTTAPVTEEGEYMDFVRHIVHVETSWTKLGAEAWAQAYEGRHGKTISAEQLYQDGWKVIEELDYL